ncbi:MAG: type II toxin-antitoxin system RelB/DinJ family antitoxin [Patescibacteria group bacterium]|nr:type II toxin-antitoxin system RelB/DinJ family antitoxin [Patescibacteria group bacterium]
MNKSAMIRARIEEKLKEDVSKVFEKLGLSTTEAITLFYKQIKLHNGLPFDVKIPNKTTRKTFVETDKKENLVKAENADDLFAKLEI